MVNFRYLDERHISGEIDLMKWNPKMDLIAISLNTGDIIVHRLVSWQKVFNILSPKLKNVSNNDSNVNIKFKVIDMQWRPDGKILAVAYDHNVDTNDDKSCVALHDVETSEMIHKIVIDGQVSCICWQQKRAQQNDSQKFAFNECDAISSLGISPFIELLPKLKDISDSRLRIGNRKLVDVNDLMKVENQKTLNVLAIATSNGFVELYAFGIYLISKIAISSDLSICYLALSSDLGMIDILVNSMQNEGNARYSLINYSLDTIKQYSYQLLLVSQTYAQSISLLIYLNESMREISEAWEDVMVEIDSKLSNYISHHKSNKASNTDCKDKTPLMADEFLELLACGNTSDTLEKFLTELTDKGLKKLGHSIELAYSNIQKLVVKNVQRVCQHLYCHFNLLKGMALWESQFGEIGLDIVSVNKTLKAIASFLLKSTELQQVIDISMRNVKAFIRWLYTSMIRLYNTETTSQSELTKVSQQDIQFVTEFIKENFEFESANSTHRPSSSNFTLERVGQYLKDKKLNSINSSINNISINPWVQYLNDRPNLTNTDDSVLYLYDHNPETSLVQEHKICDEYVKQTFQRPFNALTKLIAKNGMRSNMSNLISVPLNEKPKLDHTTNINLGYFYVSYLKQSKPANELFMIRYSINNRDLIETISITFSISTISSNSRLQVLDFQFYNDDIISLLLTDQNSCSYIVQLPLLMLNSKFQKIPSSINLDDNNLLPLNIELSKTSDQGLCFRCLDNIKSWCLAVSGSRKVACVSFQSRRRVRLFEMDVCEDEEQEEQDISDKMNDIITTIEQNESSGSYMDSNEVS